MHAVAWCHFYVNYLRWEIGTGSNDGDHRAQFYLVNRMWFDPEDPEDNNGEWGNKYEAGMIRVDIPSDNAEGHGAAVAFMQDTCNLGYGDYEAWGISSLHYGWTDFRRLSAPGDELFDQAVFPSLAIHDEDGTMTSVTYLAREDEQDEWAIFATLWDLDANSVAEPTHVYDNAMGAWSLDLRDILKHDWGSCSSLAVAGANDEYWAAWSDKWDEYHDEPIRILGRMGFADE